MKEVLSQSLVLVLLVFQFCFGVQTETMQVKHSINSNSTVTKLEYRITLSQDSFLLYDPVGIEIWIKNLGSDTAQVWPGLESDCILQDQNGKVYPSTDHILYTRPKVILPGDSLGGLTGLSDNGIILPGPYRHRVLPVGQYKVYYKIGQDSTPLAGFKIVEPRGKEAEALKLYLDAFTSTAPEKFLKASRDEKHKLSAEKVKKLIRVVDRFPQSVYAIDALSYACNTAWAILNDRRLAYQINARIMREYPDSRLNGIDFLKAYYWDNPSAFRVALDSIVKADSHPKLTANAKESLEKLETEKQ